MIFRLAYIIALLLFSCDDSLKRGGKSVVDFIDKEITGSPIYVEISDHGNVSMKIQSDTLYKYNNGNPTLIGGVYAVLFDSEGIKTSEMHSDSAVIYNNSDSVKATGDIVIESINGYRLLTTEITLYNDVKLVYSSKDVIFTSDRMDTLYGEGFWSNYDMSNYKILRPKGTINN